ncbi:MAG TPA: serine/threonine-protein kinase [Candidatus Eisenbacteria bacterium]|nr:serine/threonine-protein kinase [Candidatus Eisenbacteria bacterium]
MGSEPRDSKGSPSGWGHFTLLDRIGAGATGEVWRAWDSLLHRDVAVKFLVGDDGGIASTPLLEEARSLARVQHSNIATVYGIAEMDGRAGLWMELLKGPTLAAEISRRGALPWPELARIGIQIAAALEALAHAELVHRDVKPANVILEPGGRAVLADFGLGRRSRADRDEAPLQGTPVFMSPELLDGGQPTHRSDLYALGITLHWALTGQAPFRARTYEELRLEAGPDARPHVGRPAARASARAGVGAPLPRVRHLPRINADPRGGRTCEGS